MDGFFTTARDVAAGLRAMATQLETSLGLEDAQPPPKSTNGNGSGNGHAEPEPENRTQFVMQCLRQAGPQGLTNAELFDKISAKYGRRALKRESVRSILWQKKAAGELKGGNGRYYHV